MPYDSNGNYTLPGTYLAITGQTVQASQHNGPLEDLQTAMSTVLLRSGVAPMTGDLAMGGNRVTGLASGVNDADAATVGQLGDAFPVGGTVLFAGSTAPSGWLLCYGQAISRTAYAELFSALGTTYGSGDGSTTFNLPDCRGRVPAGKDNMGGTSANRLTNQTGGLNGDTLGATGGSETHTLTEAQLAAHKHSASTSVSVTGGSLVSGTGNYARLGGSDPNASVTSLTSASASATTTTTNTGSGAAHNNVQPTIILNMIIKTGVDS